MFCTFSRQGRSEKHTTCARSEKVTSSLWAADLPVVWYHEILYSVYHDMVYTFGVFCIPKEGDRICLGP